MLAAIFFLGLKKKKMLLFSFHFWRTVSLGWQVFLLLLPPPTLSIWRMSLVYVQLDKNSVVTPVSVSVIFPLCHWFVAIWLCSTFIFFVLSLLASKWVAAYIDVCNQIWTFDEISWIDIKFREISYGFYYFPWHPFLSAHLGLSLHECSATWTLLTSHWNRALFFFPILPSFWQWYLLRWKNIKIYLSRVQVNNTLLTIVAMAYSAAAEFLLPESLTFPIITISPKARMSLHSDSHHFTCLLFYPPHTCKIV